MRCLRRASVVFIFLIGSFIFVNPASATIRTEVVSYWENDQRFKGYIAYDDSTEEKRPGIIIVHEWWGHNEYARKRAKMLAELGYTAFAIDMYGRGQVADHPDDAGKFATHVSANMSTIGRQRFDLAYELLSIHKTVDPKRIAAIGYCFGGSTVLHMARFGFDLKGVVSFHGGLKTQTPAEPGGVKAKILVCHGGDDPFIPSEDIEAFKAEMENAGADYTFISYPGASHSFTNPDADKFAEKFGLPLAYDEEADRQSWKDMRDFFDQIFK